MQFLSMSPLPENIVRGTWDDLFSESIGLDVDAVLNQLITLHKGNETVMNLRERIRQERQLFDKRLQLIGYLKNHDNGYDNLITALNNCKQSWLADKLEQVKNQLSRESDRMKKRPIEDNVEAENQDIDQALLNYCRNKAGVCQPIKRTWEELLPKSDIFEDFFEMHFEIHDDRFPNDKWPVFENGRPFEFITEKRKQADNNDDPSANHMPSTIESIKRDKDFPIKFLLIGSPGSGKTTYLNRLTAAWLYKGDISKNYDYVLLLDAENVFKANGECPHDISNFIERVEKDDSRFSAIKIREKLLKNVRAFVIIDNIDKTPKSWQDFFAYELSHWDRNFLASVMLAMRKRCVHQFVPKTVQNVMKLELLGFNPGAKYENIRKYLLHQIGNNEVHTNNMDTILSNFPELYTIMTKPLHAAAFAIMLHGNSLNRINHWIDYEIYNTMNYYNIIRQEPISESIWLTIVYYVTSVVEIKSQDGMTKSRFDSELNHHATDIENAVETELPINLKRANVSSKRYGFYDKKPPLQSNMKSVPEYASNNFRLFFIAFREAIREAFEHKKKFSHSPGTFFTLLQDDNSDANSSREYYNLLHRSMPLLTRLMKEKRTKKEVCDNLFSAYHGVGNGLFSIYLPCIMYYYMKTLAG